MKILKLLALAAAAAMAVSPVFAEGPTTHTVGTMDDLISAVSAAAAGDTIIIKSGDYTTTQTISIAKGIIVRGETGDPADVRIADSQGSGRRAFTISHADAQVRDLTVSGTGGVTANGGHISISNGRLENCAITGGTSGNKIKGLNLYVSGSGIVTNCVISGGRGNNDVNSGANVALEGGLVVDCTIQDGVHYRCGRGSNVYISNGRLVRCKVLDGQARNDRNIASIYSIAGGIYADGGTVDSCLIQNCKATGTDSYGGGVRLGNSAVMVNCTVVGCRTSGTAKTAGTGVRIDSATAKVVNTLVCDCGTTSDETFGTANLGRYAFCAFPFANASGVSCKVMSTGDFTEYPTDLTLNNASPLVDSGTESSDWMPATLSDLDLAGNVRKSGTTRDRGCYEIDQSVFSVGGMPDTFATYEGTNVTFTMTFFGGGDEMQYRWDYGNGTVETTAEAVHAYHYPTSGLFAVRYAASIDGQVWTEWKTVSTKVVVVPEAIFVDPSCTGSNFPYKTRETAATTLETALNAMTNTASTGLPCIGTVRLRGTVNASGMTLSHPVTIRGDSDDPPDAVITASVSGKRAFMLQHADAKVQDLTVTGTGMYDIYGGHVYLRAGTVDHCIIENGHGKQTSTDMYGGNVYMTGGTLRRSTIRNGYLFAGYPNYVYGANVYMTGGRVEDTVITGGLFARKGRGANVYMTGGNLVRCIVSGGDAHNDQTGNSGYASQCGGVYATGGGVESCLIAGNKATGTSSSVGGVCVDGVATLLNCTVITNVAAVTAVTGVQIVGSGARGVNSVFFGNGTSADAEFGTGNRANFVNCAAAFANTDASGWRLIDADAFRNFSRAGESLLYLMPRRRRENPLVDGGCTGPEYVATYGGISETDLLGRPRLQGRRLDIGCLEADAIGAFVFVK